MRQLKKWLPEHSALLYAGMLLYTLERCWTASLILPYNANVDEVLKVGFALMMVLVIAQQEFTPRLYLLYGLAAVGAVTIRLRTGFMIDVFTLLIILAARQADITRVVHIIRMSTTVFLLVHTLWFLLLVLTGRQDMFYTEMGGRVRCGFGLLGPNLMASYFFNLVLMWAWERYDSIGWKQLLQVAVIATVLYKLTDSRTAYLCTLLLCVLLLAVKHSVIVEKGLRLTAMWIVPALSLFTLACSYAWGAGYARKINSLLSGRIHLTRYAIATFGFTLFGQKVIYDTILNPEIWDIWWMPTFTFDCVYSYLWSNIGTIWLVLIGVCFFLLARRGNPKINLCLFFWALYGMCEITVMSIVRFFPLLLISTLFLSKEESNRLYGPKKADAPGQAS